MAWPPRIKNSRSSAQPGTHPHDGVQATVAPVPDAELVPGSEQNAGVSGTTRAVAYDPVPGQTRPRRRRPIRYGHTRAETPTPPTVPVEAIGAPPEAAPPAVETGTVLSGVVVPEGPSGYDETAGLSYEAPYREAQPAEPPAAEPPAAEPLAAEPLAADEDEADEPRLRNDGLGIFGGVATTEVSDDEPAPGFPADQPGRVVAIGAAWNQQVAATAPLDPQDAGDSKPKPFGAVRGLLRGGGGDAEDDTGPQVGVRDLPVDVQVHFIRMRFIISIVAGVLFGAITGSWEVGLTLAILAWILDTVRRSRSAAMYQNGASFPGARKKTSRQLNKMRREGYFTLNARPIPDSREFIDHLVVGPTGVYAIDSEKWDPKLPIRTWNGKKLYHGPQSQKDRLEHAVWEAKQASEILSGALGTDIVVQPALAIYGPKIPWDITTIRNVDVFTGTSLVKYLKRRGRMKEGVTRLTGEEVRTIYQAAARMLPEVTHNSHTDSTYTPVG
jgi:hypothetical protein